MSRVAGEKVLIVGAGFGGLACAKALGNRGASVTLIDCNNYHLFVPLLYQVATADLSPANIAEPIRRILGRCRNIDVIMGEVAGVDTAARHVTLRSGAQLSYDRLVLATGSAYDYFGHADWQERALGLKTLRDARRLRARLLTAFEAAEWETDPMERRALMTVVLVGGGPTGVEMAGAIAELARHALVGDFHHINTRDLRIILVEAGERILSGFPPDLGAYAARRLERLGVEILAGRPVDAIEDDGVRLGREVIRARTIIWGAGVRASRAAEWVGAEADRQGRILVNPDLSVRSHRNIYAIGDTAHCEDERGRVLPGLAQVAKQQGEHLGKALRRQIERGDPLPAFRFRNRGNAAVVGRNAAVIDFGRFRLKGFFGWLAWGVVHVYMLVSVRNRLAVSLQWLWRYVTLQASARLIADDPSTGSSTTPDRS